MKGDLLQSPPQESPSTISLPREMVASSHMFQTWVHDPERNGSMQGEAVGDGCWAAVIVVKTNSVSSVVLDGLEDQT